MSEYIIRTTNMPEHIREAVSAWYEIDCEIVRCRDCKHYDRMNDDEGMCMVPDDDGDYARWMVDAVGYCYLGERRDE